MPWILAAVIVCSTAGAWPAGRALLLPSRTMSRPSRPRYWVASIGVHLDDAEKAPFQTKLHDFSDELMSALPHENNEPGRSIYGNMQPPDAACKENGKRMPNCETVEFAFETESLQLLIEHPGEPRGTLGPTGGYICRGLSFVECFEARESELEDAIRKHDEKCHPQQGSKCRVSNKEFVTVN